MWVLIIEGHPQACRIGSRLLIPKSRSLNAITSVKWIINSSIWNIMRPEKIEV